MTQCPTLCHSNIVADQKSSQCWYADDSSAQGKFEDLLEWWHCLNVRGPLYGYQPEGNKTFLVVAPEDIASAEKIFTGTGIKIVTGKRFLGGYIGTDADKKIFVKTKVDEWN